jgi:hypothetical protein
MFGPHFGRLFHKLIWSPWFHVAKKVLLTFRVARWYICKPKVQIWVFWGGLGIENVGIFYGPSAPFQKAPSKKYPAILYYGRYIIWYFGMQTYHLATLLLSAIIDRDTCVCKGVGWFVVSLKFRQ